MWRMNDGWFNHSLPSIRKLIPFLTSNLRRCVAPSLPPTATTRAQATTYHVLVGRRSEWRWRLKQLWWHRLPAQMGCRLMVYFHVKRTKPIEMSQLNTMIWTNDHLNIINLKRLAFEQLKFKQKTIELIILFNWVLSTPWFGLIVATLSDQEFPSFQLRLPLIK